MRFVDFVNPAAIPDEGLPIREAFGNEGGGDEGQGPELQIDVQDQLPRRRDFMVERLISQGIEAFGRRPSSRVTGFEQAAGENADGGDVIQTDDGTLIPEGANTRQALGLGLNGILGNPIVIGGIVIVLIGGILVVAGRK
jgi:hypothetical protein